MYVAFAIAAALAFSCGLLAIRDRSRLVRLADSYADLAARRAAPPEAGPFEKIRGMCAAFGQPVHDELQLDIPDELRELRLGLVSEEFVELVTAERGRDIVAVADAIGDLIVVLAGTAAAYGIPLEAVLDEIYRSNITKVDPETGRVVKNGAGKVLKPDSYEPPRLAELLGVLDDVDADGDTDADDVAAMRELEAAR